ncbi:MAG TPA: glycosyltransferase [Gemmatimonadaceae bacterium]|nr:glycosyltransferase [Gemmatimonadaceae bacterium]
MKLGYVCTNYNNARSTRDAVESFVDAGRGHDIRIAVVDNASRADDVDQLRAIARDTPVVDLLLNDKNLGYFPGLNAGIEHLRAVAPEIRHVVIGNNDLVFPADFVDTVERHQDVLDTWAVVAPDLVTSSGAHQNPHVLHPLSRVRRAIWDVYFAAYPLGRMVKWLASATKRFTIRPENAPESQLHRTSGPIEQGYGACYLLGPKFFAHFSRLAAPTFLMQEEYFLYEQLLTIGQLTYYEPRFVVQHRGHATMDSLPTRRHWEIGRDAHRVYKRFRSLPMNERRAFLTNGTAHA